MALFGDKNAAGIVLLKTFAEYFSDGYTDKNGKHVPCYIELVKDLQNNFPLGEQIVGEKAQKEFIKLYGAILRLRNILTAFDDFEGRDVLSEHDLQDYQSMYIGLYNEFRKYKEGDKTTVNDDVVFEIELVKQVDINIDYILALIKKYHDSNCKDKELLVSIGKTVDSSMELRNKKDLIMRFIESVNSRSDVDKEWEKFVNEARISELNQIIEHENLNKAETYKFIKNAFRDGAVQTTGTDVVKLLPPTSIFSTENNITDKLHVVVDKIMAFFERFFGISSNKFEGRDEI